MGNLTRDPELRVIPNGTAICQFGLAINRKFKDGTGAEREEVTFIDCEAWAKGGEVIAKYCTKGKPLFVSGRLKLDQWQDKASGEKRSKLKVVVDQFQFLGGRDDSQQRQAPPREDAPMPAPARRAEENLDEDVPF